jgi:CheY-like chemotaxis protein
MLRQLMGADVELTIDERVPGKARVDPGQFEQVVMNLAVNARDAMPHGGTLRLGTSVKEVTATDSARLQLQPGRYIVITVTDSGAGMDDATRARIFEPFFTTKPPGKGTGLGLSTVYGIIKQSQGAIELDTAPLQGTTFRVYLPLTAPAEPSAAPAARPARRADQLQGVVLVAEDEDSVRALIETVLRSAGFEVFSAASGTEAASLLEAMEKPLDLLVTDVVMPGMIGPDLARLVQHRFPETRVLYITGYATHSAVPAIFMQEDALLQKPFLADQLLAKVQDRMESPP